MIVVGASRHAKEIVQILTENKIKIISLFDNVSKSLDAHFVGYHCINSFDDLKDFKTTDFCLALGGSRSRELLFNEFIKRGLNPSTVISSTSIIGNRNVNLGEGLNIMHFVFISDNTKIGKGCLINAFASIHHDTEIGEFSEISPRATLLGGVKIGDRTSIGSGAIILPDIRIGSDVVVGAGAVVTRNVSDNEKVVGIPAKPMFKNS